MQRHLPPIDGLAQTRDGPLTDAEDPIQRLIFDQIAATVKDDIGVSVGEVIADRYRLERRIGAGGMGVVFRAHDLVTRVDVAVKVLRENGVAWRGRFEREVRALRA